MDREEQWRTVEETFRHYPEMDGIKGSTTSHCSYSTNCTVKEINSPASKAGEKCPTVRREVQEREFRFDCLGVRE